MGPVARLPVSLPGWATGGAGPRLLSCRRSRFRYLPAWAPDRHGWFNLNMRDEVSCTKAAASWRGLRFGAKVEPAHLPLGERAVL
jgi:hypothetical protein